MIFIEFSIFNILIFFSGMVLSFFLFGLTKKYNTSKDSKIGIFYLMFNSLETKPLLWYLTFHTFLSVIVLGADISYQFKLFYIVIFSLMQCLAFIDLKCYLIPNKIVLPSMLLGSLMTFFIGDFSSHILGGLIGFGVIFIVALVNPRGMGGGDIKYAFLAGLLVGKELVLFTILSGLIIGGIISLFLLSKKLISRKSYLPYAPHLFMATIVFVMYKLF